MRQRKQTTGLISEHLECRMLLSANTPDPSFSSDGIVTADFGGGADHANAVAVQADGKVIVAGSAVVNRSGVPTTAFAAVRYNPDGTLDDGSPNDSTPGDGFGTDGKFTLPVDFGASVNAIAIQQDGKIILAGTSTTLSFPTFHAQTLWFLARLNPDGTLDSTFGSGGTTSTSLKSKVNSSLSAIALQPDGKIVAVGSIGGNWVVGRFKTNGSLDTSFNQIGFETTDLGGTDAATGVAIDNIGNIVVGGTGGPGANPGFAVARYQSNGQLDDNFGHNGTSLSAKTHPSTVVGLALMPDGTIYLAVSEQLPDSPEPIWFSETESIAADGSFIGGGGAGNEMSAAIAVMPDSYFVMGVNDISDSTKTAFALAISSSSSVNFTLPLAMSASATCAAIAAAPDGSIFQAGTITQNGGQDFILVKYVGIDPKSWGAASGNVFRDVDGDQVQDRNEKGMVNVRVFDDLDSDGKWEQFKEPSVLTDADGNFTLNGLKPGNVVLREVVPGGFTQEIPKSPSYSLTITGGQVVKGSNFANVPFTTPSNQTAVNGSVFNDWNNNGKRDISNPTEPDYSNAVVFIDSNRNGKLDKGEAQTKTDGGGNYSIILPKAGSYRVELVVPKGLTGTTPTFFDFNIALHHQMTKRFGVTPIDINDTIAEASKLPALVIGKALSAAITAPTDVNLYRFTVTANQTIEFDEDQAAGSALDSFLRLFDSTGHQLASNNNAAAPGEMPSVDSYLKFKFTSAGTYYISVSDHKNTAYDPKTGKNDNGIGGKGNYTFTASP